MNPAYSDEKHFENPLQYNYYLANPDSKKIYPELNKDLSLSNLSAGRQKVILIKGRVANYGDIIFFECPMVDKNGKFIPMQDENGNDIPGTFQRYQSIACSSFIRDILSMAVTSQGLNHILLSKLTENITKHSYSMDKNYKKNIGD